MGRSWEGRGKIIEGHRGLEKPLLLSLHQLGVLIILRLEQPFGELRLRRVTADGLVGREKVALEGREVLLNAADTILPMRGDEISLVEGGRVIRGSLGLIRLMAYLKREALVGKVGLGGIRETVGTLRIGGIVERAKLGDVIAVGVAKRLELIASDLHERVLVLDAARILDKAAELRDKVACHAVSEQLALRLVGDGRVEAPRLALSVVL